VGEGGQYNAYTDGDPIADSHAIANGHGYPSGQYNAYTDGDPDGDAHADGDAYADGDPDGDAHADGDPDGDASPNNDDHAGLPAAGRALRRGNAWLGKSTTLWRGSEQSHALSLQRTEALSTTPPSCWWLPVRA
jgi:hypothetical protein